LPQGAAMRAMAPALNAPAGLTILRCPHCAAAEPVDSAALTEARMIGCRQCGRSWPARAGRASPQPVRAGGGTLLGSEEAGGRAWAARILDDEPEPPPRRPRRALLCGLAALAGLTALAGFVAQREAAVAAAPELAGLYAAVGLPVESHGLALEAVSAERRFGDTAAAIRVGGLIVNGGSAERPVPPLLIQFRDGDGVILRGARAEAPVERLAPGAAARFVVEVASVPKEAGEVLVRLGEAR
jgi:hypothetical protein